MIRGRGARRRKRVERGSFGLWEREGSRNSRRGGERMTGGAGDWAPHVGDGGVILGVDKVVGSGPGRWCTAVRRDGWFDRGCGPGAEWSGGLATFGYTVFTAPMVRMWSRSPPSRAKRFPCRGYIYRQRGRRAARFQTIFLQIVCHQKCGNLVTFGNGIWF
jgi:hypothetical protein